MILQRDMPLHTHAHLTQSRFSLQLIVDACIFERLVAVKSTHLSSSLQIDTVLTLSTN